MVDINTIGYRSRNVVRNKCWHKIEWHMSVTLNVVWWLRRRWKKKYGEAKAINFKAKTSILCIKVKKKKSLKRRNIPKWFKLLINITCTMKRKFYRLIFFFSFLFITINLKVLKFWESFRWIVKSRTHKLAE